MKFIKKHLSNIIVWTVVIALISSLVIYIKLIPKLDDIPFAKIPTEVIDPAKPIGEDLVNGEKKYSLLMKNQFIEFYMCLDDASVATKDLNSGNIWYTNPDSLTNETFKSMFGIEYYTESDKSSERDSYIDGVKRHKDTAGKSEDGQVPEELTQLFIKKYANGIRVTYRLGRIWKDYVVPLVLSPEEFEGLLDSSDLNAKDKKYLTNYYKFYPVDGVISDKVKAYFPVLGTQPVYVLNQDMDPASPQPTTAFDRLDDIFIKAGYTMDRVKELATEFDIKVGFSDIFRVNVDYTIQDDKLVVNLPVDEIWTQKRLQYRLGRINFLKYFGAGTATDSGYIVIPDKAGALIEFNKGKLNQSNVSIPVYGWDNGKLLGEYNPSESAAHFPIYGIKRNDGFMLAEIESGAEIASIKADVARPGNTQSLNYAFPSFELTASDSRSMRDITEVETTELNNQTVGYYQKRTYKGNLTVSYRFLSGDKANWVGMAETYREQLEKEGVITRITEETDLPLLIDLVGSIKKKTSVAGIPVKKNIKLTSYEEAKDLIKGLKDSGINDINLRFKGWANEGILSGYYKDLNLIGVLGGKKDFDTLVKYTNDNGIGFYPDAEFLYIYDHSLFDGLSTDKDSSRFLTTGVAYKYTYSPVTGKFNKKSNRGLILKPTLLQSEVINFLKDFGKYNISGLSTASIGTDLNSDFNEKKPISRNEVKTLISKSADEIKKANLKLMVDGCYDYMLKYTNIIANAPVDSSGYYVSDETIPLYQVILHGYVPYVAPALNQADDEHQAFLKAVEMGAGLSYFWMYADNKELKDITYEVGYSLNYKQWYNNASEYYKRANEALKGLNNELMVDHYRAIPEKDVFVTVYGDGTKVIVNYTDTQVTVDNVSVPASDFTVVRG